MDYDAVIRNVTELAVAAILTGNTAPWDDPRHLQRELERIQKKKEAVMDAYFSREISREDMQTMNERYWQHLSDLHKRLGKVKTQKDNNQDLNSLRMQIHSELSAILKGETESIVFCKTLLQSLTVFKDHHIVLKLNLLPQVFHFSG